MIFLVILNVLLGVLRSVAASTWPKVKGEVVYAGIQEEDDGESSTFMPVVEFKYKVRGRAYESTSFAFGFTASSFRFLSSSIYKKYRNRPYIKVYYNPKKPSQAVLLTGVRFFHIFDIALLSCILYFIVSKTDL